MAVTTDSLVHVKLISKTFLLAPIMQTKNFCTKYRDYILKRQMQNGWNESESLGLETLASIRGCMVQIFHRDLTDFQSIKNKPINYLGLK
jgi:hypothetical protein